MLWPVFLLASIERMTIDPGITGMTPFVFVSYPWSHSLVMAGVWALVFGAGHYAFRKDAATAKTISAVVFSHWVLDWVTHRPDLQIVPGWEFRTGLGLWNSIPGTVAVETAMFLSAAWWYDRATEPLDGKGRWGWFALIVVLLASYAATLGEPPKPGQERMIAMGGLVTWLFIPWAAWADRHRAFRR